MVYYSFPAKEAMKVATSGQVYQVAWQPGQGELLACATSTGGKILNMEQPETEAVQLGTNRTTWVAWSPAGDLLVTLGQQNVVWNSHGARVVTLLSQPGECGYSQFNASGRLVAISRLGSKFRRYYEVFDTRTGVLLHSVECFAFSSHLESLVWKDELEFFFYDDKNVINHWRIGQAEPLQIIPGQILTTTMAFNREKGILAFGGQYGTVRLWSSTLRLWSSGLTILTGHTEKVMGVVWKSQNSGILASYSLDGEVRTWDAIAKTNLHTYEWFYFCALNSKFFYGMSQVSFSPDGRFFAAARRFQNVRIVEVSTAETVAECQENGITVSWSRGGNKIAVKTLEGPNIVDGVLNPVEETVRVYNLENLMEIKLKAMSLKRMASLLEKNLSKGKDEAKEFLTNERIPGELISDVCSYLK